MNTTSDQKKRRNNTLRIAAGALAFLGIGAAVTTAAWTDQVWFAADADVATFNLQASLSPDGDWDEYQTQDGALEIPLQTSQFGELLPGEAPLTTTVYIKNASSVPVTLTAEGTPTGELFTAADATTTIDESINTPELAAGDITPVTVTLTPGDIPQTLAGATGAYVLQVSASTETIAE
ncbi:hypothetical protein PU630_06015 [Microbacterium horticulturae]|uniref:Alternate signal-mediated exported protein, RER_14450 family n=1 Tax=Microbacterium horticulturae TaxID=3028316 RepID=A0ABY8C0Y0_9MICO|nr:hypothetical protein [Microbacterium sp. KACC 23027]WEG10106.1 hypothetical protein PU630_06015 [Microbacterium sp. KACC 23027]